jgi:hypothetical protein
MAKYLIHNSAPVLGRFHFAAPTHPAVIETPDNYPPSRTWEPLDEAAATALKKLKGELAERTVESEDGKVKHAVDKKLIAAIKTDVVEAPKVVEKKQPSTLAEMAGKGKKRPSDQEI